MKLHLSEDVQKIIIDFIGINYDCTEEVVVLLLKKVKSVKQNQLVILSFCTKHRILIRKLANDNDIKDIAISYLLMIYKGPNRKK